MQRTQPVSPITLAVYRTDDYTQGLGQAPARIGGRLHTASSFDRLPYAPCYHAPARAPRRLRCLRVDSFPVCIRAGGCAPDAHSRAVAAGGILACTYLLPAFVLAVVPGERPRSG